MEADVRYRGQERGKSLVQMTKKEEKVLGVSICWGRVLLCRGTRWNLLVSRAKAAEIPTKP